MQMTSFCGSFNIECRFLEKIIIILFAAAVAHTKAGKGQLCRKNKDAEQQRGGCLVCLRRDRERRFLLIFEDKKSNLRFLNWRKFHSKRFYSNKFGMF